MRANINSENLPMVAICCLAFKVDQSLDLQVMVTIRSRLGFCNIPVLAAQIRGPQAPSGTTISMILLSGYFDDFEVLTWQLKKKTSSSTIPTY